MSDPVVELLQSSWSAEQKGNPSDDLLAAFVHNKRKFYKLWSGYFTKALMAYAKEHSREWFKAGYSKQNIPFKISYDEKSNTLQVYGLPPNANVGKQLSKSISKRTAPWGRTNKQSRNPDYQWHGWHYHRVYIPSSEIKPGSRGWWGAYRKIKSGGFWFTSKKKPTDRTLWFTKKSSMIYQANRQGYKRVEGPLTKKYTYPAAWDLEGNMANIHIDYVRPSTAWYHRDKVSASDYVMNSPELSKMLWDSFDEAQNRIM